MARMLAALAEPHLGETLVVRDLAAARDWLGLGGAATEP